MVAWSKYQQAIFEEAAHGQDHVLINAVPGAGKTTTLIELISRLPAGQQVFVTSFSKKSAN